MKKNKDIFIIDIHSFIDVITNSSTELFVCDTEKTIMEVTNLIRLKEKEWPSEHGYKVNISQEDAAEYDDEFSSYQIESMLAYLEKAGYKIEAPAITKQCIIVSVERGTMDLRLSKWIQKTFNTELISC